MLPVSNNYNGEIVSAALTEDNGRVAAVVYVKSDGSPETARWRGTFDDTVIKAGENAGRSWGELTAETLGQFGITDFTRIGDMKGMRVRFGIKHSPDKNDPRKIWQEVNYIATERVLKPVTSQGLASLNRFKGVAIEAARKSGAPRQASRAQTPSNRGDAYEGADYDYGPDPLA